MDRITYKPIGYVKSILKKPEHTWFLCEKGLSAKSVSKILIHKEYREGLAGLDAFSHIFVLYSLHKIKRTEIRTYPGPTTVKDLPTVGVFASRSQHRPNPIALRLVKLVRVESDSVTVNGLDAIDGSPVLDLKPYVAGFDRPDSYTQAAWYDWLQPEK